MKMYPGEGKSDSINERTFSKIRNNGKEWAERQE